MNGFQLLSLSILAVLLFGSVRAVEKHRLSAVTGLVWSMLWVAAAAAIIWPNVSIVVARFLGIRRGTDLVLYLAILMGFAGFFGVYLRLRSIEAQITTLVRELSLLEANRQEARGRSNGQDVTESSS